MKQSLVSMFLLLSIVCVWPVSGFSQQRCVDVLSSAFPVLDQIAVQDLFLKMQRLEAKLKSRENLNGSSLSAALKEIRNRGRFLVLNLAMHNAEAVYKPYRELFFQTEQAYLTMVQHQEQLRKLDPNKNSVDVANLQGLIEKQATILGQNYTEYSVIRRVLEAIVTSNTEVIEYFHIRVVDSSKTPAEQVKPPTEPATGKARSDLGRNLSDSSSLIFGKENENFSDAIYRIDLGDKKLIDTAAYALTRLGFLADREAFPHLAPIKMAEEQLKSVLSMSAMQQFYRENPQVIIAKIRQDLKREGTLLVKLVSTSFLQAFSRLGDTINRFMPAKYAKILFWVAGVTRDQYVLDMYLDNIESVLNLRRPTEQKLHLLMDYSVNKPHDEMLVTFARIAVFSPGWAAIRKSAEQLSNTNDVYKAFHERMLKAEQAVREMGQLSLYSNKKWSAAAPVFLVSTAALASQTIEFGPAIAYLGSLVGLQ
jgi:hypothetical protein